MTGQTRLHDALVFAQLAKHASEAASARRSLLRPAANVAVDPATTDKRKIAEPNATLI